jgi:sulfoxide reductase heme-binding subunit YedZ
MQPQSKIRLSKITIHLFASFILVYNYYLAIDGSSLTDPVKHIIHFTGLGALQWLLFTLCISPIAKQFKQAWLMKIRRLSGLWCFTFASLHIINFWLFELNFSINAFITELLARPYIWVGMASFILLFLLAITSPNKIRSRMGKSWQQLHNLIYLILILSWIHFYWSVKATPLETMIYLTLALLVLGFRWKKLVTWFQQKK